MNARIIGFMLVGTSLVPGCAPAHTRKSSSMNPWPRRAPDRLIAPHVVYGPGGALTIQAEEINGLRGEEDPLAGMSLGGRCLLPFRHMLDRVDVVLEIEPLPNGSKDPDPVILNL